MKKLIKILSVMAALAAAFTSCNKEEIVGTADREGLFLNKVELTLVKGNSEALVATATPKGAASVKWTTADKAVATVNGEGLVTAVGAGETTITVEAGERTVECLVKVQSLVTSLSLDKTEVYINKGEETEVVATVGPEDINVPFKYTWISSDESIFTVTPDAEDASKAVIEGLMGGFATLYCQAGDVTTSIPVTIDVELEGVLIAGVPEAKIYKGDSFQLEVVKDPIDAIDELSPVWSSSDESVLKVDAATGVATAMAPGTATITVESNGFTATADITVSVMATVSFYPNDHFYQVNEYLSLTVNSGYGIGSYYMYVVSGNTLTFTAAEGIDIAEIKIQTYGGYYPFTADVDSGEYDSNTHVWTGSANSVTFTVKDGSTYLTGFTVTYKN